MKISSREGSVMLISLSPDNRKQMIFLHDSQHRLGVSMNAFALKPYLHSPVPICLFALLLTELDLIGQRQIPIRDLHSFYVIVIAASGHFKESAHLADRILVLVPVDHQVFDPCSHFLPVSERKSRISSFSISNDLMRLSLLASSYCN